MDAREIDSRMRHIWLKVVKEEYERSRILEESSLHSTVYFYLRNLSPKFIEKGAFSEGSRYDIERDAKDEKKNETISGYFCDFRTIR